MTKQQFNLLEVLSKILLESFIEKRPPLPKTAFEFCNLLVDCDTEMLKNENILELFTFLSASQLEPSSHNTEEESLYFYYLKLIYLCMECVFEKRGFAKLI